MKALLQRVISASVSVDGAEISRIGRGLLVFLGVVRGDGEHDGARLARKCCELRIFEDDGGKMNRSLAEVGGEMLVVSQFTLAADCRRGRRPSFDDAAPPDEANTLYESFCRHCRDLGIEVQQGRFAAMMQVALVGDGPVTIMLGSAER